MTTFKTDIKGYWAGFIPKTIKIIFRCIESISLFKSLTFDEVTMWHDHVCTIFETVRALSRMGALRDRGALIHSYLEDGYGALTSAPAVCIEEIFPSTPGFNQGTVIYESYITKSN